jgi:hypothetical protein
MSGAFLLCVLFLNYGPVAAIAIFLSLLRGSSAGRGRGVYRVVNNVMMFLSFVLLFALSCFFIVIALFFDSISFDFGHFSSVFLLLFVQVSIVSDGLFSDLLFLAMLFLVIARRFINGPAAAGRIIHRF